MSGQGMVAFLAGLGGGYLQAKERGRKQAQEDEDRAAVKEQRDFLKAERDRVTATRNRMADAAAPVTMQSVMEKPDYADNRDVGQPGVELIDTGAKRVGQQTFAPGQMEQAAAALKEANTPQARNGRMAEVLDLAGEPVQAQQLRNGARQEQLADLQFSAAQRQHLNQAFDDSLAGLTTFDDIANTVSNSTLGGSMKLRAVPGKDGKTVGFVTIGADGKETPTAYSFANTPQGLLEAKAAVSKVTPIHQKLDFLFKKSADDRDSRKLDETIRHNRAVEGIYTMRAANSARAAQDGQGGQAAPVWDDKADAFLRERYTIKDPATGAVVVDGSGMQFGKQLALAAAQRFGGDTTRALGFAFEHDAIIRADAAKQAAASGGKLKEADLVREGRQQALQQLLQPRNSQPAPAASPAAPPAPAPAAATEAAPARPMQSAVGDQALAAIERDNLAAMASLNNAVNAARAQLQAVVKSGDPVALSRYAQELQQAIDARKAAAEKAFGNRAPAYLSGLDS